MNPDFNDMLSAFCEAFDRRFPERRALNTSAFVAALVLGSVACRTSEVVRCGEPGDPRWAPTRFVVEQTGHRADPSYGLIVGRVTSRASGRAVTTASLTVLGIDAPVRLLVAYVDSLGTAAFRVPPGTYRLRAFEWDEASSEPLRVAAGERVDVRVEIGDACGDGVSCAEVCAEF